MPASDFGTLVIETNMDGVEVFVDGKSDGVVNKGVPLKLQGLRPGAHTLKGVKMGYEPDGPRDEMVYPGQETTVSIKILIPRRRSNAALELLDKGLQYYNKGYAQNYRKAAEQFEKALAQDATYSQAALYLGRTYHALDEHESAAKYFRRAIEIDPDYAEARASFAGMLLDIGNVDEAIRQLNTVVQRDPGHGAGVLLARSSLPDEGPLLGFHRVSPQSHSCQPPIMPRHTSGWRKVSGCAAMNSLEPPRPKEPGPRSKVRELRLRTPWLT